MLIQSKREPEKNLKKRRKEKQSSPAWEEEVGEQTACMLSAPEMIKHFSNWPFFGHLGGEGVGG